MSTQTPAEPLDTSAGSDRPTTQSALTAGVTVVGEADYFAVTARGLEVIAGRELEALGARKVQVTKGGVSFQGDKALLYRTNLWLRSASRILKPLRMHETFLNTPGRKDKNSATGYADGNAVKAWTWTDASAMQGAGGLLSNAEDMMKYVIANLKPGNNTLGRAMTNSHQARMEIGRNNMKIALGWHIRNKIIWHNGGTGGFRTFAGFDPEKKTAVVVLTNSTQGADDLGFHPIYSFVHHAEEAVAHAIPFASGFFGWLTNTFFSAIIGFVVGSAVTGVIHLITHRKGAKSGH